MSLCVGLGKGNTSCSTAEIKTLGGKDDGKPQITLKDLKAEKVNLLPRCVSIDGIPVLCKEPVGRAATAPSRPKESSLESSAALMVTGEHSHILKVLVKPKNPPARTRRRQCVQLKAMMNDKQKTQVQQR